MVDGLSSGGFVDTDSTGETGERGGVPGLDVPGFDFV